LYIFIYKNIRGTFQILYIKIYKNILKNLDKDIEALEPLKYYDDKQTKKLEEFVLELLDKKHNEKYNWY
jgi:hypothetical protein